ncbi:hypothetical protein SNEBB_002277 [Seison nebaliae]|nr:hypothetical protein SNEBB_002277 [Seison nebaliae]
MVNVLPIDKYKNEIIKSVDEHRVTMICAGTGSGKSTRIPSYFLPKTSKKIYVTQPRRAAAISLATYVSRLSGCDVGTSVGYKIGSERLISHSTQLIYCTTGCLLNLIVNQYNNMEMNDISHIILDEVHERNIEIDMLMALLKQLLSEEKFSLILMSATMAIEDLQDYYRVNDDAIIKCSSRTLYPIDIFYYEDLMRLFDPRQKFDDEKDNLEYLVSEQCSLPYRLFTLEQLTMEQTDSDATPKFRRMVCEMVARIIFECEKKYDKDAICGIDMIVFVPGMGELRTLHQYLSKAVVGIELIALHADLPIQSQIEILQGSSNRFGRCNPRRVIISTNVAESSLTFPTVRYVVDFCQVRTLCVDHQTTYTSLRLQWVSQSSLQQRSGRIGRVQPGICFRLISKNFFKTQLRKHVEPAMKIAPLSNVILMSKRFFPNRSPVKFLSYTPDPPAADNICHTILLLKQMGALMENNISGKHPLSDQDGQITYLGHLMLSLPIDCRLTRLIFYGFLFGTVREAIVIASILSKRSFYYQSIDDSLTKQFEFKFHSSKGGTSDVFAMMDIFRVFERIAEFEVNMDEGLNDEREMARNLYEWAKGQYVSLARLREVRDLKTELLLRLKNTLLNPKFTINDMLLSRFSQHAFILQQFMIIAAFYPFYYEEEKLDYRNVYRQIPNDVNPKNVCILPNLPSTGAIALYADQIKEYFTVESGEEPLCTLSTSQNCIGIFKNNCNGITSNYIAPLPVQRAMIRQLNERGRSHSWLYVAAPNVERSFLMSKAPKETLQKYYKKLNDTLFKERNDKFRVLLNRLKSPVQITYNALGSSKVNRPLVISPNSLNAAMLSHLGDETTEEALLIVTSGKLNTNNVRLKAYTTHLVLCGSGFIDLILLIFSPTLQLKYSKEANCYLSGLFGLGPKSSIREQYEAYDRCQRSVKPKHDESIVEGIFEEHDIYRKFDVLIDKEDFVYINYLRNIFHSIITNGRNIAKCMEVVNEKPVDFTLPNYRNEVELDYNEYPTQHTKHFTEDNNLRYMNSLNKLQQSINTAFVNLFQRKRTSIANYLPRDNQPYRWKIDHPDNNPLGFILTQHMGAINMNLLPQ